VKRNYPNGGKGMNAVDLGCGAGAQALFLAKEGFDVLGFDGSQAAIERCIKRKGNEIGVYRTAFAAADICSLPLPDETFDLVVDAACLQHVPDADLGKAMREACRVLKKGGRLWSYAMRVGTSQSVRDRMPVRALHRYDIGYKYAVEGTMTESVDSAEFTEKNGALTVRHWIIVQRKVAL
jgi:ubiquinone/menaquinone biosynthesis C-methylase UbiE